MQGAKAFFKGLAIAICVLAIIVAGYVSGILLAVTAVVLVIWYVAKQYSKHQEEKDKC
jgi:Flp pilus assembly protein TadB